MALTDKIAFCTLADLKDDLGISDSSSDARLERRILSASEMIQRYLNRPLRREVGRVEKLPGFGTTYLFPSLTPIESIASIEFDGAVVDPTRYETTNERTLIYAESGWEWTVQGVQTISAELQPVPGSERPAFEVTFTGGYWLPNDNGAMPGTATALPVAITEACLQLATMLHLARGRDQSVQSEQTGNASVSYRANSSDDAGGLPASIARMLAGYRRAV